MCSNFGVKTQERIQLLEIGDLSERGFQLLDILTKESQLLEIKASIQNKARLDMDQQQREYYLQQQMKTIQEELGGSVVDQELKVIREKAAHKKWNSKVEEVFNKELKKMERMHPNSPDFPIQLNYVDTLVSLPWDEYTKDNFDFTKAQRILDRDLVGLEKVKERIGPE